MTPIKDIDLPIYGLTIEDAQSAAVGFSVFIGDEITSIKPYREQYGSLWFTVWASDKILRRINGRFVVEVSYLQGE